MIDERRKRIRAALDEADQAREPRRTSCRGAPRDDGAGARARPRRSSPRPARSPSRRSERQRERAGGGPPAAARGDARARSRPRRRAALELIRSEVADLTVIATQKVTGKVLDAQDHKRLIDEAIGELDFSVLERGARTSRGSRRPHVRASALRGGEGRRAALDEVRDELGDVHRRDRRGARAAVADPQPRARSAGEGRGARCGARRRRRADPQLRPRRRPRRAAPRDARRDRRASTSCSSPRRSRS